MTLTFNLYSESFIHLVTCLNCASERDAAMFCWQVMEAHMRGNLQLLAPGGVGVMSGYPPPMSLLPQTNLPQNLPLVQNLPPQNFSIKDQHLLKPPPFMHAGVSLQLVSWCGKLSPCHHLKRVKWKSLV